MDPDSDSPRHRPAPLWPTTGLLLIAPAIALAQEPATLPVAEGGLGFHGTMLFLVFLLNLLFTVSQVASAAIGSNSLEAMEQRQDFLFRTLAPLLRRLPLLEQQFGKAAQLMLILMILFAARIGIESLPGQEALGAVFGMIVAFAIQMVVMESLARNLTLRHPARYFFVSAPIAYILSLPALLLLLPGQFLGAFPRSKGGGTALTDMHLRLLPSLRGIERVVDEEAVELIGSVRDFAETTAEEVMTPRTEVEAIPNNLAADEVYQRLNSTDFSRIVVFDKTIDNVEGTLLVKEVLLQRPENPYSLLRKPIVALEKTRLPEMLRTIRAQRSHLVCVIDEYGGFSGVVTLHDLFEVIVGHMDDQEDGEGLWIERVDNRTWRLNGRIEVWELNEELDLSLPEDKARTVGGLIFNTLGRIPEKGDGITLGDIHLRVEQMREHRVEALILEMLTPQPVSGQEAEGEEES